jgi:two-component system CheB/CheR fusion protein
VPVRTVTDREMLQPGTVFVVPANRHVEITDHDVTVRPGRGMGPSPSIDLLLSSAADVYGEALIAVILTGTGSDGAAGARHVKEAGGTVLIQNPRTAAYPTMPLSLAPATVDLSADLEFFQKILVVVYDQDFHRRTSQHQAIGYRLMPVLLNELRPGQKR